LPIEVMFTRFRRCMLFNSRQRLFLLVTSQMPILSSNQQYLIAEEVMHMKQCFIKLYCLLYVSLTHSAEKTTLSAGVNSVAGDKFRSTRFYKLHLHWYIFWYHLYLLNISLFKQNQMIKHSCKILFAYVKKYWL